MLTLIMFCFRSALLLFFTLFWNEIVCRIYPGVDMINSWVSLAVLFLITYIEFEIIRPMFINKNNQNDNDKDNK
jgi:hypothetical protein